MQSFRKYPIACLFLVCLTLTGCTIPPDRPLPSDTSVTSIESTEVDDSTATESNSASDGDSRPTVDPVTDGGDFQGK